jgi:hypothetical protein
VDYSRAVRSDRYKLIYNVTPNLRYSPVDSAGDPSWQDIVKAHEGKQLASEFETLWFTSPRAIYELYDLESDPSELRNLAGQPEVKAVEQQLKEALQGKMILDFDYLPLPIAGEPKKKQASTNGDPSRAKQFEQKDTDKNGELSKDEFFKKRSPVDATAWFTARDADNNGVLSREEFVTGNVANPPKSSK